MKELVFFLEEPSAQAMLQGLLPRMLAPDIHVRLIPFEGKQQGSARFRQPDHLGNPSEELAKLTRGAYQKLGASRLIGPQLDLDNERSPTFKNLVKGIKRLEAELLALPAEAS